MARLSLARPPTTYRISRATTAFFRLEIHVRNRIADGLHLGVEFGGERVGEGGLPGEVVNLVGVVFEVEGFGPLGVAGIFHEFDLFVPSGPEKLFYKCVEYFSGVERFIATGEQLGLPAKVLRAKHVGNGFRKPIFVEGVRSHY